MGMEKVVLAKVEKVAPNAMAYFCNGTLFLDTIDSKIATDVFFKLTDIVTAAISYGKCGNETSYDFL